MDAYIVPSNTISLSQDTLPLILVVDDREENLEAMRAVLDGDENWRLRCVTSGEAALRCLLQEDVFLVLLDVQMPDMDGYEVAELMRGNPKTRHTPIIFVSAIVHTQDSILRGYSRGAVDFILKPFDSAVLRQKINNLLSYENNRRALLNLSHQLERARAFNASILSNAAEGILVVEENGLIQYANPAIAQMLERDVETLQGSPFLGLFPPPQSQGDWFDSPFYRHWHHDKIYRLQETTLQTKSGAPLLVTLSCSPLAQPQKAMVIILRDIAIEHKLRQRLEALIITDPLTDLLNRRGFYQALESALARAKRADNHLAVIYLDLDGFKNINDSLGHNAGDDLLCHVATQLKSALRPYDALARLGGDEFTILLDSLKDGHDSGPVVEKLMKLISTPYKIGNEKFSISASVGIACYPECGENAESLLRAADMAMYEVKSNGRQHYRFHSPQLTARAHARLELEQRLRQAVEQNYFALFYQPQYNLKTGRLRGFEALLRWPKGNPDKLSPEKFIPRLEETRLINPLGQWILNEGVARLADLRTSFGSDLVLSINVSPIQFAQENLVENLSHHLNECGLPPAQLEIEVTEGVLMQDLDITRNHLSQLRQLGVSVAVDDFGTGYSSLAYLRQFELDILKIDRLFITNMLTSARDAAVVNTILDLSRNLKLQVVAEGVETETQRQWLTHNGCDIMQGYLASRPLSFEEALKLPAQLNWAD